MDNEVLDFVNGNSVDIPRLVEWTPKDLFVGGAWEAGAGGERFAVINPATGAVLAKVASAGVEDAAVALDRADAVQEKWAATAPRERAEILRRAFELMDGKYRPVLAATMTLEMGKPLGQANGEVTYGAEFFRWFSEEACRVRGDYYRLPEGALQAMVVKRPVGPCVFVTPWNFPLAMGTRKIGPALAAGCVCLWKPARDTPLTALFLARIMEEAGLPAGVLSVLPTTHSGEVTEKLLHDPRVRKLSFTGSTEVGKSLLKLAADQVLRTSMELGGNAPFVVFDDADIDRAVESAMATKMRNMGEACNAGDHFFVQDGIYDEFVSKFSAAMQAQKVGDGLEAGVEVGPLINRSQLEKVSGMVERAVAGGAKVAGEPNVPQGYGFFFPPTVLTDVSPDSEIVTEEIFGPVAPVVRFDTEENLVRMVNSDKMGLGGYIHTSSWERIMRLAEKIEIGMIGFNAGTISNAGAPFGGVKQSGLGREGSTEGIEEYLETIYIGLPAPKLA